MLAVVKTHHTQGIDRADFRVEGSAVPEWLVDLLKKKFPTLKIEKDDDALVDIKNSAWYRRMSARQTPAQSLRIMRTAAGLTQVAVARKTGILKQNISAMEKGTRKITLASAQKLAKAIGTSFSMFYKDF